MKKFFYLLPVAFGLLALSSCSNDDLNVSKSAKVDLSDQYVLNVVDEDDVQMRGFKDEAYATTFTTADTIRVYDSQLHLHDKFAFADAGYFTISAAKANITELNADGNLDYAYALWGAGEKSNISYAGTSEDGYNIALLKIEDEIKYEERASGETTLYKSTLPMWGTVTSEVSETTTAKRSFTTSLRYLTARAKVVFKNGAGLGEDFGAKQVRATSLKFLKDKDIEDFEEIAEDAEGTALEGLDEIAVADKAEPLAGWFEAVLDPEKKNDGVRKVTDQTGLVQAETSNTITVNVPQAEMENYTNVVFIPIVPATYDLIVFEYSIDNGATWNYIGYAAGEINRGDKIGEDWDPIETGLDATLLLEQGTTVEITNKIAELNSKYEGIDINLEVNADHKALTALEAENLHTIYIPQLKNNFIVTFEGTNAAATDLTASDLVIADKAGVNNSNDGYTIEFDFQGFAADSKKIQVKAPTTDVILGGTYTNAADENTSIVTEAKSLTLKGSGISKAVDVKAGDLILTNGGLTKVNNLVTNKNTITVKGGTLRNVEFSKAGDLVIEGGLVRTVTLGDNNQVINMTGGSIAVGDGTNNNGIVPASKLTADRTVTVTTSGAAQIKTITGLAYNSNGTAIELKDGANSKKYTFTFNSTWDANTSAATGTTAQAEVYTAAQLKALASQSANATTLYTDVTINVVPTATIKNPTPFSSITLGVALDGKGRTISGLTAPLFTKLEKNVSNLNIGTSTIEPKLAQSAEAGAFGAVADEVEESKTVVLTNVQVSGVTIGLDVLKAQANSANYGLLVGKSAGTLTITDCGVNGTLKGYCNLGGYVGNVAGGTLTITKTSSNKDKFLSKVTILKTFSTTEATELEAGRIGHFVGTISGTGVTVEIGDASNAKAFSNFFSESGKTDDWTAKVATKTENNKVLSYKGMQSPLNFEIGRSEGTVTGNSGKLKLYGKTDNGASGNAKVDWTLDKTANYYAE